jgi:hypothetical protein
MLLCFQVTLQDFTVERIIFVYTLHGYSSGILTELICNCEIVVGCIDAKSN